MVLVDLFLLGPVTLGDTKPRDPGAQKGLNAFLNAFTHAWMHEESVSEILQNMKSENAEILSV